MSGQLDDARLAEIGRLIVKAALKRREARELRRAHIYGHWGNASQEAWAADDRAYAIANQIVDETLAAEPLAQDEPDEDEYEETLL